MKTKHDLSHLSPAGRSLIALRSPIAYVRLQSSISGDVPRAVAEELREKAEAAISRAVAKTDGKPGRIKIVGTLQIYVMPPEVDDE